MAEPAKSTQPPDRDEHERPAATAMSDQERVAIRKAGADDARRSRTRQGLTERIEDPAAVAILRDARAPPSENTNRETGSISKMRRRRSVWTRLRRSLLLRTETQPRRATVVGELFAVEQHTHCRHMPHKATYLPKCEKAQCQAAPSKSLPQMRRLFSSAEIDAIRCICGALLVLVRMSSNTHPLHVSSSLERLLGPE
jgi:hypothetical protein